MRVGIDCRTILNPGFGENAGVGHYTYYLVSEILKLPRDFELVLFFDERLSKEAADRLIGSAQGVVARFFPFHEYKHFLPVAYSHILMTGFISREKLDVFHLPGGLLPLTYTGRSVVTIHDLAIVDHPEWFPPQVLATRIGLPQTIKRAMTLIVPSHATAANLEKHFKVAPDRIAVIPEGVEVTDLSLSTEETIPERDVLSTLSRPYLLFLGTLEPRKNIPGLLRAYLEARAMDPRMGEVGLVVAGAKGWKFGEIEQELERAIAGSGGRVRYLGYVSHQEKFALIQNALAFIFPSFTEGFGLPVLEAMALGTPVIASNTGSLPEVMGDAGMLVLPDKTDELAQAILEIATDEPLRGKLSVAGKKRAAQFSWRKTAEETVKVYAQVGALPK